jgi:hypothetical protein
MEKSSETRRELKSILLLSLNVFLLLITYYVLKTVREALILTQGGAEVSGRHENRHHFFHLARNPQCRPGV